MLIPDEAWAGLIDAGVTVRPVGSNQVELAAADGSTPAVTLAVQRRRTPLSPSHVLHAASTPASRPVLLITPSASPAALAAAENAGWSVIVLNTGISTGPTGRVRLPGRDVVIGAATPDTADERRERPGPRPWGTYALVRQLLIDGAATQQQLAHRAEVTQARVSQTLNQLRHSGLVDQITSSRPSRWEATDRSALIQWWLGNYPGPGGISSYWYGLTTPTAQAAATVAALHGVARIAVSGDVAADLLAPWRRPVRAVVYADLDKTASAPDLHTAGLTPAGADEATLELIVPADRSVWSTLQQGPLAADQQLPLADLAQVLWDVRRAPGADADQALHALLPLLVHSAGQPEAGRAKTVDS